MCEAVQFVVHWTQYLVKLILIHSEAELGLTYKDFLSTRFEKLKAKEKIRKKGGMADEKGTINNINANSFMWLSPNTY